MAGGSLRPRVRAAEPRRLSGRSFEVLGRRWQYVGSVFPAPTTLDELLAERGLMLVDVFDDERSLYYAFWNAVAKSFWPSQRVSFLRWRVIDAAGEQVFADVHEHGSADTVKRLAQVHQVHVRLFDATGDGVTEVDVGPPWEYPVTSITMCVLERNGREHYQWAFRSGLQEEYDSRMQRLRALPAGTRAVIAGIDEITDPCGGFASIGEDAEESEVTLVNDALTFLRKRENTEIPLPAPAAQR